eukprot:m.137700 g.137700  ORF g.137700 m.137700 type:complete len:215 (-) comp22693_c0_seq1:1332-1976(-)
MPSSTNPRRTSGRNNGGACKTRTGMISTRPSPTSSTTPSTKAKSKKKKPKTRERQTSMLQYGQLATAPRSHRPLLKRDGGRSRTPLATRTNIASDGDGVREATAMESDQADQADQVHTVAIAPNAAAPESPRSPPQPTRDYAEIMRALEWHCSLKTPDQRMASNPTTGAAALDEPPLPTPFELDEVGVHAADLTQMRQTLAEFLSILEPVEMDE